MCIRKNSEGIGGKEMRSLRPMVYNFDPTLAPEGKTLLRVVFPVDYDYWERLKKEKKRYEEEKEKVAKTIINILGLENP